MINLLEKLDGWLRGIVFWGFGRLNACVPKKKKQVVLHSFPDFDDMIRALLDEIFSKPRNCRVAVLIQTKQNPIPDWAKQMEINVYFKMSFRGIWFYLRSEFVFFTHGLFSKTPSVGSQVVVNVWHGMPIKAIGLLDSPPRRPPYFTYTLASSEIFLDKVARSFGVSLDRVLKCGLPRLDILNKYSDGDRVRRSIEKEYKKLILWMPTYRESVVGDIRRDGDCDLHLFGLFDIDVERLNEFLVDRNYYLLVKPHPMAAAALEDHSALARSNFQVVGEDWIMDKGLSLYQLLAACDLLITDISSVYVDYKVLNRPVIIAFDDRKEYFRSRVPDPSLYNRVVTENRVRCFIDLCNRLEVLMSSSIDFEGKNRHLTEYCSKNNTAKLFKMIGF